MPLISQREDGYEREYRITECSFQKDGALRHDPATVSISQGILAWIKPAEVT